MALFKATLQGLARQPRDKEPGRKAVARTKGIKHGDGVGVAAQPGQTLGRDRALTAKGYNDQGGPLRLGAGDLRLGRPLGARGKDDGACDDVRIHRDIQ